MQATKTFQFNKIYSLIQIMLYKMKYLFSSFLLLLCIKTSIAQYTDVINSKRPGFSDSPYSIGTRVYQIEGGFFYKNINNRLYYDQITNQTIEYNSKSYGSDITIRGGLFFERLEFNLDFAFENEDRNNIKPIEFNQSEIGISKLTFGAKYLIFKPKYKEMSKEIRSWKARHSFDKKRLIPAVGIYVGVNTNFLNDLYKNPEGISPKIAIYTQNDITNRLIFLMNFVGDKLFTYESENSYIFTLTYTFTEQLSLFIEHQGFFRKNVPNDYQVGGGAAYLFNKNLQIDASFRAILDERSDLTYMAGAGLSWRLDRHEDKIIRKKIDNNEPELDDSGKKGFFGKMKSGVGGLFSKKKSKGGKRRTIKKVKAKTRDLTPPVNKKANKARKKQSKRMAKQQNKLDKANRKANKNIEEDN